MDPHRQTKIQSIDPFWESILNRVKTFRNRDLPPEGYQLIARKLDKCLSLTLHGLKKRVEQENT